MAKLDQQIHVIIWIFNWIILLVVTLSLRLDPSKAGFQGKVSFASPSTHELMKIIIIFLLLWKKIMYLIQIQKSFGNVQNINSEIMLFNVLINCVLTMLYSVTVLRVWSVLLQCITNFLHTAPAHWDKNLYSTQYLWKQVLCTLQLQLQVFIIGTSGRRSSRSAFTRSTGNTVSGHCHSHPHFFPFSVTTFSYRGSAWIKKLI